MEKVEFCIKPSMKDVNEQVSFLVFRLVFFRLYFIIFISAFAILSVSNIISVFCNMPNWIYLFTVISFFGLVLPIGFILSLAKAGFKASSQVNRIYYVNKDGYGLKTDFTEFFAKWEGFEHVEETDKYILMKLKRSSLPTIYKYLLPPETVSDIKKIIADAPIKNKKLL